MIKMCTYKLLVDFHEGIKDYVDAYVYDMGDHLVLSLPSISKPIELADYNFNWKNGLYPHYEMLAKTELQNYALKFIHL